MSNTDADTAISALDKLIDQELAAVRAASRDGSNSSRSKPSRWTFTGFLRSGWTSRRRRSSE